MDWKGDSNRKMVGWQHLEDQLRQWYKPRKSNVNESALTPCERALVNLLSHQP